MGVRKNTSQSEFAYSKDENDGGFPFEVEYVGCMDERRAKRMSC